MPRRRGRPATSSSTLLAICQAALPNRTLSPDDNLFELGTGSLTLAQIYEKVEATYPGHLEVTDFFEYPTVRTMAACDVCVASPQPLRARRDCARAVGKLRSGRALSAHEARRSQALRRR